jgi:hypothetical protein
MNIIKATFLAKRFEHTWTHLQIHDSSELSHVYDYPSAKFDMRRIGCAPKGHS